MVFVGFSTPRTWNPLSQLIRAMTHSRTSHTWLLVEDPVFELRLVLEAHTTGFRLVSFARFVKENKVVALVKAAHPIEPGLPAAGSWLGEKFDVLGLFGIFLTLIERWFRQGPLRNPFPSTRALYCSESVVRALKAAAYPGSDELGDETTTPADLLAWLEADPANVVYERQSLRLWRDFKAHRKEIRKAGQPGSGPSAPAEVPPASLLPPAA